MTVSEIISALQYYPSDLKVVVNFQKNEMANGREVKYMRSEMVTQLIDGDGELIDEGCFWSDKDAYKKPFPVVVISS